MQIHLIQSRPASRHATRAVPAGSCRRSGAFTLIEIMVVVGIMGLILAAGVPSLYRFYHKEGFRKTVSDLTEVCTAARADAILKGVTTEILFYPRESRCALGGGSGGEPAQPGALARSVQFNDTAEIKLLEVNMADYRDTDIARVRFFPDGTCDELVVILRSHKDEYRILSLEITTGLVTVDSDLNKWKR